ncbi:hypothetical protein ACFVAV_30255 [Nocardia sp. NPDC057663]|uniref:hypothetical protein n=1 Tax=Nocardia sp. NPDC057663 TaxID=3346201 RepID=UPI00366B81A3
MPLDVRAAGALVLLYGLPVTRIHRLNIDDLLDIGGDSFLRLDRHQVLLPPPPAQVLRTLAHRPRRARSTAPQQFLFPGSRTVDAPIAAYTLTARTHYLAARERLPQQ